MSPERLPPREEHRAILWWNSMQERHRREMLRALQARGEIQTAAGCWLVFGRHNAGTGT